MEGIALSKYMTPSKSMHRVASATACIMQVSANECAALTTAAIEARLAEAVCH